MPALSFVLVVHREQAHLERCVAAMLDQPFTDVELLAVDDASPDHGPRLLDELAERHAAMRVIHLPERVGRGAARNLALDAVGGEHVWFVETTDRVAPGALAGIAELLRTGSPDVLLVHHAVADALGRSRPGPQRAALARAAERGPGPLEQHPDLAAAAPRVWDKVLRRSLLRELDLRFGDGEHGELPVAWPALLAADSIAASADVGYVRQRPGNAVRDRLTAGTPFDVFGCYEAVFDFADAHAVPEARRRLVAQSMLRHQLALLRRVPESARREFFHRSSESYERHRRGDEPAPAGRTAQLRARLVAARRLPGVRAARRRRSPSARRRGARARLPRRSLAARSGARAGAGSSATTARA